MWRERDGEASAVFCRLAFGYRGNVRDSIQYNEDGSYIYPVGHSIVFLSADGRTQRFIPGSSDCEGITATALSPNRKLLAVAEKADKAVISVYDTQTLRRRKVLQTADVGSRVSSLLAEPCLMLIHPAGCMIR